MKEKQEVKSLWARKKTSQQNEYVQGKTSDLEKGQRKMEDSNEKVNVECRSQLNENPLCVIKILISPLGGTPLKKIIMVKIVESFKRILDTGKE